jgi:tripartite-type tricarboxylate transporter receptor subunit TctC
MPLCRLLQIFLSGALLLTSPALAQTYPERPVKIVVPIGPGGSYDIVGRLLADQLSKRLGQNFFVENRTGAGTSVGTQAAASAPHDGYTLLVGGLSNIVFNAGLYKKLGYDPLVDFVPVALVYSFSYVLVGSKDLAFATAKEIVDAARRNPDGLKLANAGLGTGQHLAGAAFMKYTGTKLLEIPYKGTSAVYPDLLTGRVDLYFDSAAAALPYIKSGQAKGIATLTAKRNRQAPDVPTMTESGVPGLEIDSWIGLFAPARTPPAVIARLQKEIAAALPELKERFEAGGGDLMEVPPERLKDFVKSEYDKWIKIIQEAGIQLD